MGDSKAVSEGIHSVTTFASPLLFPLDGARISFPNFGFVFVSFSRFGRSFWHDLLGGVGGRAADWLVGCLGGWMGMLSLAFTDESSPTSKLNVPKKCSNLVPAWDPNQCQRRQDPGERFKMQFPVSRFKSRSRSVFQDAEPSFKIQFKIQVSVSRRNSKFQDSSQDPVPRFKMQFQVSRFKSRSRSVFQDAEPSFKIQFKITQVSVPRCNSKFQDSSQDPVSRFKMQFQVSRFKSRSRLVFHDPYQHPAP